MKGFLRGSGEANMQVFMYLSTAASTVPISHPRAYLTVYFEGHRPRNVTNRPADDQPMMELGILRQDPHTGTLCKRAEGEINLEGIKSYHTRGHFSKIIYLMDFHLPTTFSVISTLCKSLRSLNSL